MTKLLLSLFLVVAIARSEETDLFVGGVGGAYFLAEPGGLTVEVAKRDRNRRDVRTELRAILVGPDRRVIQECVIPDDAKPKGSGLGPIQRCQFATHVDRKGVYALNITVSQDRYGNEAIWSLRTNCRKYMIETARGHRDERHQEPIVLASPDKAGDFCFMPRRSSFDIELTDLPKEIAPLRMLDGKGELIAELTPSNDRKAVHTFPANVHREAVPWRLHFPSAQAVVNIDGLTRWSSSVDPLPPAACWTPDPTSWFPLLQNRWLLTPYSPTVYGQAGEQTNVRFALRNDSPAKRTILLAAEFPEKQWPVKLPVDRVNLAPGKSSSVDIGLTMPAAGTEQTVHLRVTPEDDPSFSTYSTIVAKAKDSPVAKTLELPLVLKPYRHENEQFGYLPDYPVEGQVYFDKLNRPFVATKAGIATLRDGRWVTLNCALKSAADSFGRTSFSLICTKISFDRDNDMYALAMAGGTAALLHSSDGGQSFVAYAIPGREKEPRTFEIEEFTGHNMPDGPPPILRYTRTAHDQKLIWRSLNDLEMFLPKKVGGKLVLGEPILVSNKCIGLAAHSGIPSSVVSKGPKVHVIWGEATDPKSPGPGVPAFVVTYDRESKRLSKPALAGQGAPANDVHNTPSMTIDGLSILHTLAGTHGRPFPYAQSLQPNDAAAGWTEPAVTGENLSQTYIGMVCGPDNTLHSVFRLWRNGMEPFPSSTYATLAYQRKRPGQPWETPRVLIVPPFSEYSVYYHRLTIDRKGRLFVSYDYWSTFWFYRNDLPDSRRALMMSADGGDTWNLVETSDLNSPLLR